MSSLYLRRDHETNYFVELHNQNLLVAYLSIIFRFGSFRVHKKPPLAQPGPWKALGLMDALALKSEAEKTIGSTVRPQQFDPTGYHVVPHGAKLLGRRYLRFIFPLVLTVPQFSRPGVLFSSNAMPPSWLDILLCYPVYLRGYGD